MSRKHRIRSF